MKKGMDDAAINRLIQQQRRRIKLEKSPDREAIVLKRLLSSARRNAGGRGHEFKLKIGDLEIVTHCPIFGMKLVYGSSGGAKDNSASLDRIDSKLGYIPGNVWVISWKANRIKSSSTPEELRKVADAVDSYNRSHPKITTIEDVYKKLLEKSAEKLLAELDK